MKNRLLKIIDFGEPSLLLKESDLVLRKIDCKIGGVDPICVIDPDHPCCEKIPREVKTFERGELVKQGNSAILSLKICFNDPMEEFIFDRIRNELWRNPGSHVKIIREPEEGFQISFFFDVEMVKNVEQRQRLIHYWSEFERNIRGVLTDGKIVINKYVRSRTEMTRLKE